jgi:hypothetical protein
MFEANLGMLFRELIRTKMGQVCEWNIFFENIDLTDKMALIRAVPRLVEKLLLSINEGRRWIGEKPTGKWADHFYLNHPSLGWVQVDTPDGQAKSIVSPEVLQALENIRKERILSYFEVTKK